ncbi:MAG: hypothetical protein AAGI30_08610 [Planctomycetota bacterium]
MRRVRVHSGQVRVESAADPAPGPGEALVSLEAAVLLPEDIAAMRTHDVERITPGAAFVGRVEAVSPERTDAAGAAMVGRRVVASIDCPPRTEEARELAARGLGHHAGGRGERGRTACDGCFAERFAVSLDALAAIDESVDAPSAALALPLGDALAGVHRAELSRPGFTAVVGDGAVTLLAVQLAVVRDPSARLIFTDERTGAHAERWGIKHRHLEDTGRRADQASVITSMECAAAAMGFVAPRGRLVLVREGAATPIETHAVLDGEADVVGARSASLAEAVGVLERGEVDAASLISSRHTLEGADEAFAALARGGIAALIEC